MTCPNTRCLKLGKLKQDGKINKSDVFQILPVEFIEVEAHWACKGWDWMKRSGTSFCGEIIISEKSEDQCPLL